MLKNETSMKDRMTHLSSIYHTGPVTALHCHGNIVLAGLGSQVHVYSIPDCELQYTLEVLPARVVHGIKQIFDVSQHTNLCVYGQKCLRLLRCSSDCMTITPVGELLEFADWIWDVTWIQGEATDRRLCLALGHNVIVTYDVDKQCIISSIHCQEKCILYCAKFLTSKPDCVILAAGTVFNQVVIWSAQSTVNATGRVEPFHRLTGHQGVIFSVDYHQRSQLICSVSDDRSIRLYKIRFPPDTCNPSPTDWEKMDTSLLHVLYGHSARVWDVRLLSASFVSVGEDSTCCLWSYDGRVLKKFKGHKGKSIWSMCVDKGENYVITGGGDNSVRLWHLQLKEVERSTAQTRTLDLKLDQEDFPRNTMLLNTEKILAITNMGKLMLYNQMTDQCACLMSDDSFGSYTVMGVSPGGRYIAIGNIHGILRILYESERSSLESPQFSHTDIKVCDGKLLSIVWLGQNALLTTAPDGIIDLWEINHHDSLVDLDTTFSFELSPSKHRWVSAAALVEDGNSIIVGDRTGSLFLYMLNKESKIGELAQSFLKIHGKAGVTFVCCHDNYLFSAGRDGIYRKFVWTENGQLNLLHNKRVCKGFEWIERLNFTSDDDVHVQGFYTNLFVIWSVEQNQKLLEIECGGGHRAWDYSCHGNKATFVYVKTREVKVTNVKMGSNQVIVKKCLHGRELCDAKLICSGTDSAGNRVTALVTCSEDTSLCLSLLYSKNGTPQLDVRHCLTGHISTVRCLCVCSSRKYQVPAGECENPRSYKKLIFSGGGRAQLKAWYVEVKFEGERKEQRSKGNKRESFDSHISKRSSEIAELQCQEEEINQISVQSNKHEENIGQSCVKSTDMCSNRISFPFRNVRDSSDNYCKLTYLCLADFQLSSITRKCRKPWRQPVDNSDPETRILDLSVVTPEDLTYLGSRSLYFISAACSDGLLRLLAFDEVSKEINLVAATSYHDHCVLKTCHVIVPKHHHKESCDYEHVTQTKQCPVIIFILSTATDGKVAFWDVTDLCRDVLLSDDFTHSVVTEQKSSKDIRQWNQEPVCTLQLHQSGINSVYFGRYSEDSYILLTGGDDNAVHVNIVTIDTKCIAVKVVAKGSNITAHAAQITGTWFVAPDCVVTASIDQRISVWNLEKGDSKLQLRMIACVFTSVSDVANIDMWKEREHHCLLISGNGLEVFKLETSGNLTGLGKASVQTSLVT